MLSRWQSTIVDAQGNVQPLANLTVRNEADQSLAKMWASPGATQPLPDGMVQADGNGYAFFYARGGLYRITSVALGIDWRHVALGSAATHDVTASATDITPGRVVKTRDYGLGIPIHPPQGTDLDELDISGQYNIQNPVNGPDFGSGWIYLEVIAHSLNRNYALQRAYPLNSFSVNGYGEAYRVRMGGTWQPWQYNMPQSSKDVALEYTGDGGLVVRTLNNNGSSIFSVRSSGGAERLTVHHGANPLRGGSPAGTDTNWYINNGAIWHQNNMPRVQGTGQSTTAVMSQKAVTDALTDNTSQEWVDVTAQRSEGTIYTNDTNRPIEISIYSESTTASIDFSILVRGEVIGHVFHGGNHTRAERIYVKVPPGAEYQFIDASVGRPRWEKWSEYR